MESSRQLEAFLCFLPQSEDMQVRGIGNCNLSAGVNGSLSYCVSPVVYIVVTFAGRSPAPGPGQCELGQSPAPCVPAQEQVF